MRLQISNDSVQYMRDLATKIPNSLEGLEQANNEIMRCYHDVQETIGPHTQEICAIVDRINQLIKQTSDSIHAIPDKLNNTADRFEHVLSLRPDVDP